MTRLPVHLPPPPVPLRPLPASLPLRPPTAAPVAPGDRYLAAYAELHELVRRFLAGDANLRYLRRRHAEVEDDLRAALGLLPYPARDPTPPT